MYSKRGSLTQQRRPEEFYTPLRDKNKNQHTRPHPQCCQGQKVALSGLYFHPESEVRLGSALHQTSHQGAEWRRGGIHRVEGIKCAQGMEGVRYARHWFPPPGSTPWPLPSTCPGFKPEPRAWCCRELQVKTQTNSFHSQRKTPEFSSLLTKLT